MSVFSNKIKNGLFPGRFLQNISNEPKDWFTSVFYSICIVIFILLNVRFSLTSFEGRIISRATIEDYDIDFRVHLYFLLVFVFFFSVFLIKTIAAKAGGFISGSERLIINYISLAGILLLFFGAVTAKVANMPVLLILAAHGIILIKIIFRIIFTKKTLLPDAVGYDVFVFSLLSSFSVSLFLQGTLLFLGYTVYLNFYLYFFISGSVMYFISWNHLAQKEAATAGKIFQRILRCMKPLSVMPFIAVLTTELYLILNNKNIYDIRQCFIFLFLIILCIVWFMIEITRRQNKQYDEGDYRKTLFHFHLPVFLSGMMALISYIPVMREAPGMFEIANPVLSVQQFYEFGKIPFIDTFNSHELSEILFPFLYTWINGYSDLSFLTYNFLENILAVLVIYFFLLKFTRNPYIASFTLFFVPFSGILLPVGYFSVLIIPLFLLYLHRKQTISVFFILFCILFFLIIWRIDIGYSGCIAAFLFMGIYSLTRYSNNFSFSSFRKAFLLFLFALLILFSALYIAFGQKLIHAITAIYSYFNSAQTFGFPDLAEQGNYTYFLVHYFVFPVIISCLITGIIIMLIKNKVIHQTPPDILILFLFLSLFYLINFHRGLIRHALIENTDYSLTSFGFFILGGSIFLVRPLWSELKKFIFFICFSGLLIIAFKFPKDDIHVLSYFGSFLEKTDSLFAVNESGSKIARYTEDSTYKRPHYEEIADFLRTHLQKDETFIDFVNSPMLYFYSHKKNPVFFNQPMHCSHNEYLQKRYIDEVSDSKIPYVIFSKYPEVAGVTDVDGIPNAARYFLIAEYIYRDYRPFAVINNFCIWKKNGPDGTDSPQITTIYNAGNADTASEPTLYLTTRIFPDFSKRIFLSVNYTCREEARITVQWNYGPVVFSAYPDSSVALFELKNIPHDTLKNLQLSVSPDSKIKIEKISIIESNYIPDVFSTRSICFSNLKFAPYIWGQFDERSAEGRTKNIISLTAGNLLLKKKEMKKISFAPVGNKQQGNYLIFKIKNLAARTADINVAYGKGGATSGSFTFRIKDGESENRYVLRISTQYNWLAENNDWISITPAEDIEISSIEITEAD